MISAESDGPNSHSSCRPSALGSTESDWKSIGAGAARLLITDHTLSSYLGVPPSLVSSDAGGCFDKFSIIYVAQVYGFWLGLCKKDKTRPSPFGQTLTGLQIPHVVSGDVAQSLYQTCAYAFLLNNDKCTPGDYVIVRRQQGELFVARVHEIIQKVGSEGSENFRESRPDGILLQTARSASPSEQFQMPELSLKSIYSFVPLAVSGIIWVLKYSLLIHKQNIMCTVNTVHNCPCNKCESDGFHYVYQERVQTAHKHSVVLHSTQPDDPDDRVLNTAQMRDAEFLQMFRIPSSTLTDTNVEQPLYDSVASIVNAWKAAGAGVGRGVRGRGRGIEVALFLLKGVLWYLVAVAMDVDVELEQGQEQEL